MRRYLSRRASCRRQVRCSGSVRAASRFCRAYDELRDHVRAADDGREVPRAKQRGRYVERLAELETLLAA